MKSQILLIFAIQFLVITLCSQVPDPKHIYPPSAHLIPVDNVGSIQDTLDKYKIIRFENADYRYLNSEVTLKSGYEIYGLPSTRIDKITVEPGTFGAVVSNIISHVYFPQSNLVTKENYFRSLYYALHITEARLENNVFVDTQSRILADTDSSGYMRNNRFIRTKVHGSVPVLSLKGNNEYPSYGNVFLWCNWLTPLSQPTFIENQKSLTFAGADMESYAEGCSALNFESGDVLTVFGFTGGQAYYESFSHMPLIETNAKKTILCYFNISTQISDSNIIVHNDAESIALIDCADKDVKLYNQETDVADIWKSRDSILFNDVYAENLTNEQKNALDNSIGFLKGKPWQIYEHDETIPARRPDSVVINDHTAYLQALIDSTGIAFLDSGVYYISKPLVFDKWEGIIGQGKGKTIIRALNDTVDMIVNAQKDTLGHVETRPHFFVAELSLENGRNGIMFYTDKQGTGIEDTTLLSSSNFIRYVELYNMSNAGIYLNSTNYYQMGFDNNFIEYVDFFRCKSGIKKRVPRKSYSWLDKVVFYRNRYIENEIAVDLSTWRSDNLNAWIECLFKDNTVKDMSMYEAKPVIALCKFKSPYADTVIFNGRFSTSVIQCEINSGKTGATIFSHGSLVEGSTITANNAEFSTYKDPDVPFMLFNSTLTGVSSVNNVKNGIFYNSTFNSNDTLSKKLIQFTDGVSTVIINNASDPAPSVLIDGFLDCNGDICGSASIDDCGVCSGGKTGITPNSCLGVASPTNNIRIYPNPTTDNLFLSSECQWKIFNLQGIELLQGTGDELNVSGYATGIYLIQTEIEKGKSIQKFVIEK